MKQQQVTTPQPSLLVQWAAALAIGITFGGAIAIIAMGTVQ